MRLGKLAGVVFSAIAAMLLLTSCDAVGTRVGMGTGFKPQFYEYDGGMINLNQVSVVATRATISVSINPRAPQGEWGTEAGARYEAHQQFCGQSLSAEELDYRGGIPGSAAALSAVASKIAAVASSDLLNTCAITLKTSAAIALDDFTITQASGVYVLPVAAEMDTAKEGELGKAVAALIEKTVAEPNDWETQYRVLKSKVSL